MVLAILAGCADSQFGSSSSGLTASSEGSASASVTVSVVGVSSSSVSASSNSSRPSSSSADVSSSGASGDSAEEEGGITLQDAKTIALRQVGLAYYGVVFTREEEIEIDGAKAYAIGLVDSQDRQFDLVIDAATGAVQSMEESVGQTPEELKNMARQSAIPYRYVEEDDAVDIACADAGVARSDIADLSIALDFVKSANVHSIDFLVAGTKYHYDIDIREGRIISSSVE